MKRISFLRVPDSAMAFSIAVRHRGSSAGFSGDN